MTATAGLDDTPKSIHYTSVMLPMPSADDKLGDTPPPEPAIAEIASVAEAAVRCLDHALGEFSAKCSTDGGTDADGNIDPAATGNDDPPAAGDKDPDDAATVLNAFFDAESQRFDMDHYVDGYVSSHPSFCDALDGVYSTKVAPYFLDITKHSFMVTFKGRKVKSKSPLMKHYCSPFPAANIDEDSLSASPNDVQGWGAPTKLISLQERGASVQLISIGSHMDHTASGAHNLLRGLDFW